MKYTGTGPWDDEPDSWDGEAYGLPIRIRRAKRSGHLCGYVVVPSAHPLHGVAYHDETPVLADLVEARERSEAGQISPVTMLFAALRGGFQPTPEQILDVHGGITWSGCMPGEDGSDEWCFGFDCAHAGDYQPGGERFGFTRDDETYRTFDFVKSQCEHLAEQLAALSTQEAA